MHLTVTFVTDGVESAIAQATAVAVDKQFWWLVAQRGPARISVGEPPGSSPTAPACATTCSHRAGHLPALIQAESR